MLASDLMTRDGPRCAGPTSIPILHLHLLQRCNLSCAHCYSSSGPGAAAALSQSDALGAVSLAQDLGYTHLAISGGEPLLWPDIGLVIGAAKGRGMHVSVVTNGLQAATPRARALLDGVDIVTVSLDGIGATHDAMRGRAGAYDAAVRALAFLSDAGLLCGVACGVSRRSLNEMEEVVSVALAVGARFVHFHAVEAAGRATTLQEQILSSDEHTLLYVASHLIANAVAGRIDIHCDLLHKSQVIGSPSLLYAQSAASGGDRTAGTVADRLGVLVVEPDGTMAPVCFGIDRRACLGTLTQAIETRGDVVHAAVPTTVETLARAGTAVLARLAADDSCVVLNPSEVLVRQLASRSMILAPLPVSH